MRGWVRARRGKLAGTLGVAVVTGRKQERGGQVESISGRQQGEELSVKVGFKARDKFQGPSGLQ